MRSSVLTRVFTGGLLLLMPSSSATGGEQGLAAALAGRAAEPIKCATPMAFEAALRGASLLTASAAPGAALTYETPEGHFVVDYGTTGAPTVSLVDADSSGVPDYVEWAGQAMEQSWSTEVESFGFPALDLSSGRYQVLLRAIGLVYGWTTPSTSAPGGSTITLNSDFEGFYQSLPWLIGQDPDGKVRGAIRVTAAHEFKHAIQFAQGGWESPSTGLNWPELDATWAEDVVFDQVNDYYNYITGGGSPFTAPATSLLFASYEDSPWELFLSERYGLQLVVDFAALRAAQPALNAQTAYRTAIENAGLDFTAVFGEYGAWNYATGSRSAAGFGYGEAGAYPTSALRRVVSALPDTVSNQTVAVWAHHFHSLDVSAAAARGALVLDFEGDPAADWAVTVLLESATGITFVPVTLSAGVGRVVTPEVDVADLVRVGVIVSNATLSTNANVGHVYGFRLDADTALVSRPGSVSSIKGAFGRY